MNISLIILAYNEEKFIKDVVSKYINYFDEVIVVNDNSRDETKNIIQNLEKNYENLTLINNTKNFGAGKSLEIGINHFLESKNDYLIKIDGDDQFSFQDVIFLKDIIQKEHFDFIKCDRFWHDGIIGKIPTIRYLGNSFASFLIKFSTGSWSINDPLNGLFLFSKNILSDFKLPKLFYRYGYPFFVVTDSIKKSIVKDIKIGQFKNEIKYQNELSNLNPIVMFFKLIWYTLRNYYSKINLKIKISEFQISALLDILSQVSFIFSIYSFYKIIIIRYFSYSGPQGIWFMVCLIFLFTAIYLISLSQKIEKKVTKSKIVEINRI